MTLQLTESAPPTPQKQCCGAGGFGMNAVGIGQAVALNQDESMSIAANPASAGSYVTVYFTGSGVIATR